MSTKREGSSSEIELQQRTGDNCFAINIYLWIIVLGIFVDLTLTILLL